MKSVELLQAFAWLCPHCALKNFVVATVIEMSLEEKKELMGIEPWEAAPDGDLMSAPEKVKCERCKKSYRTKDPFEED